MTSIHQAHASTQHLQNQKDLPDDDSFWLTINPLAIAEFDFSAEVWLIQFLFHSSASYASAMIEW